jgi:hypothetical protein
MEYKAMDVKTLLDIVDNRMKSNDGNPTTHSFLFELQQALMRLQEYEWKEKENISKIRNNIEKNA